MDERLFESLLYRSESETLDFKVDQYTFAGGTDEEKSELLKDILAFANAWRDTDAHILIGVQEQSGGKALALGISKHLSDHEVQQFVSTKTYRPVKFSYEVFAHQRRQFGIIRIPVQERPVYLVRKYGRLEPDVVYIRRGSSTSMASPTETSEMGKSGSQSKPVFELMATPRMQRGKESPYIDLVVQIRNSGQATANDLMILVEKATSKRWQCHPQFWKMKKPAPNYILVAEYPLHPGAVQELALFYLGKTKTPVLILSPGSHGDNKRSPVQYEGAAHRFQLRIHGRDISPVVFQLELTAADIESLKEKPFSLIGG